MAWLIVGPWAAKSIHLSHIALHLPWPIQKAGIERRLSRFPHHAAVRGAVWYEPVARQLVAEAAATLGEVRLIMDTMPVHHRVQAVMVSLAFRRRAFPLAWTWVNKGRGHRSSTQPIALPARVRRWMPKATAVSVVGDNEFGSIALIRQPEAWGWAYALRQKGSPLVRPPTGTGTALEDVVTASGESRWYEDVLLTGNREHRCHGLAHWGPGEKEAWFLATSFSSRSQTLRADRRRMGADERHRDLKSQGFHLHKTHIWHWRVLSRLFLALALLYVWPMATGTQVIKQGRRHPVDRRHRRDLSVFGIGYDMLIRSLCHGHPVKIRLLPYFR